MSATVTLQDVRHLVGAGTAEYSHGDSTYWTDAQLQAILDKHRTFYDFETFQWFPLQVAAGSVVYKRAQLQPHGQFEPGTAAASSGTVTDGNGSALTGWTLERDGWITWGSDLEGTVTRFTGYSYDIFGAAAEVLETWASHEKLSYDVSLDAGQRYARSQKIAMLEEAAAKYRRRAVPRVLILDREE